MKKKVKEMKPSGKYPALFYQEGCSLTYDRIRIIHPDGSCDWRHDEAYEGGNYPMSIELRTKPCWAIPAWSDTATFENQIKKMHNYDFENGMPPAIFLGEIK